MSYTRLNSSAATLTKNRTEDAVVPISGMCATCVDGCIGMCEIGKSAYRGAEMIYPQPFGIITTAGQKDYPVDLGHFTILGRCAGAWGMEQDSNRALFPAVDLEVALGRDNGIRYKLPFTLGAMGSTNVAKNNWPGLAAGAAITGTGIAIGENVVGMDMESRFENGRVLSSVDLEWRVKCFREWQMDDYGEVYVQANVEDTMLGVQEYAIKKLGVRSVELKWGQGAKDIGGEVKIKDLNKAQELQRRGYVVLPESLEPDRDRGLQERQLPRVRAPLARRHGEPRGLPAARGRAAQVRRQVHHAEDRRLSPGRPGARGEICVAGRDRPADRGRSRRRHRHVSVAHDE